MSTSSPHLTEVSSPASFATPLQSPDWRGRSRSPEDGERRPFAYCEATRLGYELESHCQILIEEQLYSKAIFLLTQMLVSGQTRIDGLKKPAHIAPPEQLALLSTITVHPHRTTRLKEQDEVVVVGDAWAYLRSLLDLVGPSGADFAAAFRFRGVYRARQHHDDLEGLDEDAFDSKYAKGESLFHRAEDLWHVFGWAFNCSVLHPHRWQYWKDWLEFILDAMEMDWEQRQAMDSPSGGPIPGRGATLDNRRGSLLMIYILQLSPGRSRRMRVLRAIFADGKQQARRVFLEVFHNEPRQLTDEEKNVKLPTSVDLDKDDYGGYMDLTDSDGEENGQTPKTPMTPRQGLATDNLPAGYLESAPLRLRLFRLLSSAAGEMPELSDFAELGSDFVRYLLDEPVSVFQLCLSSLSEQVNEDENRAGGIDNRRLLIEVLAIVLDELLARDDSALPLYEFAGGQALISGEALATSYLPKCATSQQLEDNARVSIALETALSLTSAEEIKSSLPQLRQAVVQGTEARKASARRAAQKPKRGRPRKTGSDGRGHLSGSELYYERTLELSGERMTLYVDCLTGFYDEGGDWQKRSSVDEGDKPKKGLYKWLVQL